MCNALIAYFIWIAKIGVFKYIFRHIHQSFLRFNLIIFSLKVKKGVISDNPKPNPIIPAQFNKYLLIALVANKLDIR